MQGGRILTVYAALQAVPEIGKKSRQHWLSMEFGRQLIPDK